MHLVLFARLDALYQSRESIGLDGESLRVLERYHLDFVRAGAQLKGSNRDRLADIAQRLAVLGTQFSQNVLADEENWILPLSEAQMAGIPASIRDAAASKAADLKIDAAFAVTLSRSSAEPFLQYADDRAAREQLYRAWVSRGDNPNTHNNSAIITEMLALRAERATLLGHENFAAFKLADSMAGTPQKARALLEDVWGPARKRALEERDALQELITREGGNFRLAPWDWRYYAEKLRQERYDFDEAELKPYFQLGNLIEASFYTAQKLFGLSFRERHGMPVYHPDVRIWEVLREGEVIGLFYGDYFARAGKQGGAWMSSFRDQERVNGNVLPIIINNCNFSKSDPCLLSFDDAVTLFHEFGHALHGLLSQFLASALIDMDFHTLQPGSDPLAAQAETLTRIGMPEEIAPRHAAPHFTHVFSGDGYSAGYYAYMWSEVLDADGFKAFEEAHDPFDPATAHRLHKYIYASGGTRDYATAYRAFRGRDPHIEALLEGRSLTTPAA